MFVWPAEVVGQTGDVIILLEFHIFMRWPAHVLFIHNQWKSRRTLSPRQSSVGASLKDNSMEGQRDTISAHGCKAVLVFWSYALQL